MQANILIFDDAEGGFRNSAMFFTISVAGHLIVFLILMIFQNVRPDYSFEPSVINVDLVSLSAPPSSQPQAPSVEPEKKTVPPKTMPDPAPVKIKSALKEKIETQKIKPKTSLKKKTFKSSKVVASAIAQVQKKFETSQSKILQDRLAQLSNQVETSGKGQRRSGRMNTSGSIERITIYKMEILYSIQKNWSYNPQFSGDNPDLVALLGIKIMPDGEIREVWFDQHSGDRYFDESARKAVLKSNPLPPLPDGFNKTFLNQGLRFTPSGVK